MTTHRLVAQTGRGRSGWFDRTRSNQKTKSKKTIQDYAHYVGSLKQASDCSAVTKFLINHMRKTYTNSDDIADALEAGKTIDADTWKPNLKLSTADATTEKEKHDAKNKECTIMHKSEVDSWIRRRDLH